MSPSVSPSFRRLRPRSAADDRLRSRPGMTAESYVLSSAQRTTSFGSGRTNEKTYSRDHARSIRWHHRRARAILSDAAGHRHRALSGWRPDRPGGAADRPQARGQARPELRDRERQRRRHQHRRPARRALGARWLHLVRPQSAILGERVAVQIAAVRHREGFPADRHDQLQSAGAGRAQDPRTQHAAGAGRVDEEESGADGSPGCRLDRTSRHRPARAGVGR